VLDANFDLHVPFAAHEAAVAADRRYFCYDAPWQVTARPTSIDIPLFIRQTQRGTPDAAARMILIVEYFGRCAWVCPSEDLCEQACARPLRANQ
jgi:glutamate synthase (NADPH/NADH) small chain